MSYRSVQSLKNATFFKEEEEVKRKVSSLP